MKSLADIRTQFLDYFKAQQHQVVPSSSLVPVNDPSLLFTNAGMVQFKDVFLGLEHSAFARAASSQRCVRAGGKHNDLENVGYTARHHTFFEMLGNFSFGDYFKHDAIHYAWDFLVNKMGLEPNKLWVTVYEQDDDAADIWLQDIGIDPQRFSRIGEADNFWQMGDTGPCGPCSEIFYDHGPAVAGGPPGTPEADGDRYIEIWNLVFMQYNRSKDGQLTPLPKPSVDTGMGLERLAAVMQGVHSNYEIDLFQNLIKATTSVVESVKQETHDITSAGSHNSLQVIADHIRSCAFLIADGVIPSNEGRGYVLRRIIRRAIRHGHKLGCSEAFFYRLVAPLAEQMGAAYPELVTMQDSIATQLQREEQRFAQTLGQGMQILDAAMAALDERTLPGELVFKLYDTYGFPVDLTADIARERGLDLDMLGYENAMAAQRQRGQQAGHFSVDMGQRADLQEQTDFVGYQQLEQTAEIVHLLKDQQAVDYLSAGEEGAVVLQKTPFYAESGGQVGDRGEITFDANTRFIVKDTQQLADAILHLGVVETGDLHVGLAAQAKVDAELRRATVLNHSATHLLHAALRQVLGTHVQQKGSLVDEHRLRFDFSHAEPVSPEEIRQLETLVNAQIRANLPVAAKITSLEEAKRSGAIALFGEKYGEQVRVLSMGDFSIELCGGTHVNRSGDIGLCKIVTEIGVAAGVRRIEAITGATALAWLQAQEDRLQRIAHTVKTGVDQAETKISQLVEHNRKLEKELRQLSTQLAGQAAGDMTSQVVTIEGLNVLAVKLDGADRKTLLDTMDQLKNKLGSAAIVLATVDGQKISLAAGVTKDQIKRIKAGDLVNHVAQQVGGRGGGRPDLAQAGGNNPAALAAALDSVVDWVRQQLSVTG